MRKTLNLEIDRASWLGAPALVRKTCPFPAGQTQTSIDFLGALLWAGTSAVSIRMPQWWLASQWAILRYIGAADHSTGRLRLHEAANDLETHSKKVLSDDWGVGISLQWLTSRLSYRAVSHAAFVMDDLRSIGVANFQRRKKRGPAKSPDFFAVDAQNKIHIIECKGNQAGTTESGRQFVDGRLQKRNIRFSTESLVGQRLVSGVAIAGSTSRWRSTLLVADPPPHEDKTRNDQLSQETYQIKAEIADPVIRSINKVSLIQGLLLAGAFTTAHRAFPRETGTQNLVVSDNAPIEAFASHGLRWRGLSRELRYPVPIRLLDETTITGSRLRFGVSDDLIALLNVDDAVKRRDLEWGKLALDIRLDGDLSAVPDEKNTDTSIRRYASVQRGDLLIADLELLEG
jgi:hypothetical protein